jgi:hypothetical protein
MIFKQPMDVPDHEQCEYQMDNPGKFIERYLIIADPGVSDSELLDAAHLPSIDNPEPDAQRNAFLTQIDLIRTAPRRTHWCATLHWLRADDK